MGGGKTRGAKPFFFLGGGKEKGKGKGKGKRTALPFQRRGWGGDRRGGSVGGSPGGGAPEKRSPWGEIANGDGDGERRTRMLRRRR